MLFKRFNPGIAAKLGDELAAELASTQSTKAPKAQAPQLERFLQRVDQEVRPLRLGWFGRARLANAFKWKLLEAGFPQNMVDELTHMLLLRLSGAAAATPAGEATPIQPNRAMRRAMAKKR